MKHLLQSSAKLVLGVVFSFFFFFSIADPCRLQVQAWNSTKHMRRCTHIGMIGDLSKRSNAHFSAPLFFPIVDC